MLELAAPQPDGLVVDAGCGCGATLALLREYGQRVVGLDLERGFWPKPWANRPIWLRPTWPYSTNNVLESN